jgi:tetraacyldisaccharide 4'-kinase
VPLHSQSTVEFINYLEDVISGKQRGASPAVVKFLLLLVSWISLGVVKLRRWLYTRGMMQTNSLPCKVISVGNIVVGGSGKTPVVAYTARMLKECSNLSVAILSRGYRGEVRGPAAVSDGQKVIFGPVEAGDEAHMLARALPGVPVLIGKDRSITGFMAFRKWKCDVVILDDGFQHLKLARDVDIIVMDATRPFGLDHVLPRGYLREPLSTLNSADLILLTRVDQCKDLNSVRDRLSRIAPSVPVFESVYEPRSLRSLDTQQEVGLDAIRDRDILAVCGIANPLSFFETLKSLGPAEVSLVAFPDHFAYPPRSIEAIRRKAAELKADMIVTTEKDAPKLGSVEDHTTLSLTVELKLLGSTDEEFMELILRRCGLNTKRKT